jgi:hypothetical protein
MCSMSVATANAQNQELNVFQTEALKKFSSEGLTASHLQQWHAKEDFFGSRHIDALAYLMRTRFFSPEKAVVELCDLGRFQVEALTGGLTRDDVIGLQNFQIISLEEFKKYELTADHLRLWKGGPFFHLQNIALKRLFKENHLNPDDAMVELNKIQFTQ